MEKEKFICLTHYINPQLFWYILDTTSDDSRQINALEIQLRKLYKESFITNYRPVEGEIVAVYFLSWNKYIRAKVQSVARLAHGDEYIVWAVDHGFPFQTDGQHVRRLPDKYGQHFDHVRCGGLAGLLAAEKEFNFVEMQPMLAEKKHWHERACGLLEQVLNDAASISFTELFRTSNNQFWGELKIVNHQGKVFKANEYLLAMDLAKDAGPNFKEICLSLNAIKISPWLGNNGNYKIRKNHGYSPHHRYEVDVLSDEAAGVDAKQKVADWCDHNQRANDAIPFEINDEMGIDNIGPEDSVSALNYIQKPTTKKPPTKKLTTEKPTIERTEQNTSSSDVCEQMINLGGVLTNIVKKKYAKGKVPPPPQLSDFDINFKDTSEHATESMSKESPRNYRTHDDSFYAIKPSGLSDYQQKLLDMRKKYESRRKAISDDSSSVGCNSTINSDGSKETDLNNKTSDITFSDESSINQETSFKSFREQRSEQLKNLRLKYADKTRGTIVTENRDEPLTSTKCAKIPENLASGGNEVCNKSLTNKNQFSEANMDTKISSDRNNIHNGKTVKRKAPLATTSSSKPDIKNGFEGLSMVPAGFDLANLCTYNDEKNHWHRKKSTLNDHIPHSANELLELSIKSPLKSSTNTGYNKERNKDENFRDTRSHTDKYKEAVCEPNTRFSPLKNKFDLPNSNVKQSTKVTETGQSQKTVETTANQQPYTLNRSQSDIYKERRCEATKVTETAQSQKTVETTANQQPYTLNRSHSDIYKERRCEATKVTETGQSQKTVDTTAKQQPYTLNGSHSDIYKESRCETSVHPSPLKYSSDFPNSSVKGPTKVTETAQSQKTIETTAKESYLFPQNGGQSYKKTRKRRQLKSPATQMHKIEEILQKAKIEKEYGNENILDLTTINSNYNKTEQSILVQRTSTDDEDSSQTTDGNNRTITKITPDTSGEEISIENVKEPTNMSLNNVETNYPTINLSKSVQLPELEDNMLNTVSIEGHVLAHSKVPLYPTTKISDVLFQPAIHDALANLRKTKVYRTQAYAWPFLLRGNSLFIVNPTKSGKTWSYLPPVCSLVDHSLRTVSIADGYGPIAIILVASSVHVNNVYTYGRRLLANLLDKIPIVACLGLRNIRETKLKLLNSCGILVATAGNLARLLRDNENESLIHPERLKSFVIDDMDIIKSRSMEDFEFVVKSIFKLKKPKYSLQLMVTSRDWDPIMVPLMRSSDNSLLLIGDFLEAAVYGKAVISIKLTSRDQKIDTIMNFIRKHPLEAERMIILCNSDEDVHKVESALTKNGLICIGYYQTSENQVRTIIDEWKRKLFCTQIIICTDDSFPELEIKNAQNLIHYSMPTSWTKFTWRFSSLAQTYENSVISDFRNNSVADKPSACSLILLDNENSLQLPRLINFMKKHHQENLIHPDILKVSDLVLLDRVKRTLCPFVLEFGDCDDTGCSYRHNLIPSDAISKSDDIPTSGDMRIKILKVFSPTYYSARLLQHKLPNSQKWCDIRCSDKAAIFSMKLSLYYSDSEHLIVRWPLEVNDMCIYKASDTYQRAIILDVPHLKYTNVVKRVNVTIKLIDAGDVISDVKSDELFVCDEKFKNFPAQAINIRLSDVVPLDNDRTWDPQTTKTVQKWIMDDISKEENVFVSINFSLANTVWVNNVIVKEHLPTLKSFINRVNLKRLLLEKKYGSTSNAQCPSIRDKADGMGLIKTYDTDDRFNLTKEAEIFSGIATDSDKENLDNSKENIEIGAPLTPTNQIVIVDKEKANYSSVSDNEKYVNEEWCKLHIERITKVEIGDENENGKWNEIYLQCIDDFRSQKFNQLLNIINCHIEKVQALPRKTFEEAWFQPMKNCIVKHEDGRYLRAKLHSIFGNDVEDRLYRFFLCDYACFLSVKSNQLYSDFLYETTKEIVEFTPYQAVRCTLAGIKLDPFTKCHRVSKSYLYAYALNECDLNTVTAKSLKISSFEILLYECDTEDDFSSREMLNKALLDNKCATPNPETQHLLDVNVNFKINYEESPDSESEPKCNDFNSFLQTVQRCLQLEEEDYDDEDDNANTLVQTLQNIKPLYDCVFENGKELLPEEVIKPSTQSTETQILPNNSKKVPEITKEKPSNICEKIEELPQIPNIIITDTEVPSIDPNTCKLTISKSVGPSLVVLYKRPKTTWYETDYLLYFVIHAPDVVNYYLEVTKDSLTFATEIDGQKQVLVLNFLGLVDPQYVSHEIRGLNVIVRLVKSTFIKFPRLLWQTTRFQWLTYDLNSIDRSETQPLMSQESLFMALENCYEDLFHNGYDSDSGDSENELYQNYTPIVNSEDVHDPTMEIF